MMANAKSRAESWIGVHLASAEYSVEPGGSLALSPIVANNGSLGIICNGEIYNSPSLRRDLQSRGPNERVGCRARRTVECLRGLRPHRAGAGIDDHLPRFLRDQRGDDRLQRVEYGLEVSLVHGIEVLFLPRQNTGVDVGSGPYAGAIEAAEGLPPEAAPSTQTGLPLAPGSR